MKISYYSLGCKVNLYESEAIVNEFVDNGFTLCTFDDICDVYLINTCSITEVGDAKSRKIIRQAIKRNPNAIIAVMGCYAQLNPEIIKKIKGVDVLIGTSNRDKVYSLVMSAINTKSMICEVNNILDVKDYEELKIKRFNNKTRGFVKIQDGCDNYCSYCTIPYARGHIRSRLKEDVIEEINTLSNEGMKEIVLTGINTGSYGKDLNNYTFSQLLEDIVLNVENLGRIRISSIEETEITTELLNVIKKYEEHFCMHFHIPLQGGCDKTLKRMHRKYNISDYVSKIELIRSYFKDVNITTDILAGFCGESTDDFKESYDFIKSMNYGEMHVFPYSRRPRTVAYKYLDQIDEVTKHIRTNELINLNDIQALNYRKGFVGKTLEVIVEKNHNNICFGHSSNYIQIEFEGNYKSNDLVKIKMKEANYPVSIGEVNEF